MYSMLGYQIAVLDVAINLSPQCMDKNGISIQTIKPIGLSLCRKGGHRDGSITQAFLKYKHQVNSNYCPPLCNGFNFILIKHMLVNTVQNSNSTK